MPLKKFLIFFIPLLVLAVFSGSAWFWFQQELGPVAAGGQGPDTVFVITEGEPAVLVLADLSGKSLIRSSLAARIYLKIHHLESGLRPGSYVLSPGKSVPEILAILSTGPEDVRVTIPEGWRREQIAARLNSVFTASPKNFSARDFIRDTATLEGRLFPDTYLLPPAATTADVIRLLTANFAKKTGLDPDSDMGKTTLILASLVEREAKSDADRAGIASVIKNRYRADWPLQIDASVQYAQDNRLCTAQLLTCDWWRAAVDTKFPSAYNTYLHPGLPPGPICNPGLSTIDAVINASDSAYWYYMTGSDGVTRYAETLDRHNLNIDKYLVH